MPNNNEINEKGIIQKEVEFVNPVCTETMVNYVMVAAGQCGNQLSFDLLTMLHQHYQRHVVMSGDGNSSNEVVEDDAWTLYRSLFRDDGVCRTVCLDTEPKVIESCLAKSRLPSSSWQYDPKAVLYRHGGAGNNWALGYSMASGEFLEMSMDCIRRQLEQCDDHTTLVFLHSLAGGTGSGLGTHITEAAADIFADCFRSNIVIAPHHFGEVVVQHYNALLCLSKIHNASNGILLFENELAQALCREMHGIERPLLQDLNHAISSNLLPLFIPKRLADCHSTRYSHLSDDLTFLCSHPGYRFYNIKLTPQTSKKSIDYTYDSWSALLKTIQRMQMSGAPSERHIRSDLKSLGRDDQMDEFAAPRMGTNIQGTSSASKSATKSSPAFVDPANVMKTLSSVVSCHGETAAQTCQNLHNQINGIEDLSSQQNLAHPGSNASVYSKATSRTRAPENIPKLYEEYFTSHSDFHHVFGSRAVQCNYSNFALNRYKRSTCVLANDQSILPILQRSLHKSNEMFSMGAYVHQYTSNGLEYEDFVQSFRSVGSVVQNYVQL